MAILHLEMPPHYLFDRAINRCPIASYVRPRNLRDVVHTYIRLLLETKLASRHS